MKTYREMTESVLQKAGAEILKKERRRRNLVCVTTSGLCLALLLTVLGMGMEQLPAVVPTVKQPALSVDATDATQPVETQAKLKVTYLSNIEGQTTLETVSPDVFVPLSAMVRIRDTRGLSEEEADKVLLEEIAIVEAFRLPGKSSITRFRYPEVITHNVSNGAITLDVSGCPTVTNVDVQVDGIGAITKSGLRNSNGDYHYFVWQLHCDFVYELTKDPTFSLESIHDIVTLTVNYVNGTSETLVFDITADIEGMLFITQRGIPTEAA